MIFVTIDLLAYRDFQDAAEEQRHHRQHCTMPHIYIATIPMLTCMYYDFQDAAEERDVWSM